METKKFAEEKSQVEVKPKMLTLMELEKRIAPTQVPLSVFGVPRTAGWGC